MVAIANAPASQEHTLLELGTRTATGNSTGIDISDYEGLVEIKIGFAVVSGTTPSDTITIETSAVIGSGYAAATTPAGAAAAFAAQTATGIQRLVMDCNGLKQFVRLAHVISGTTPSFGFTATITGCKKSR